MLVLIIAETIYKVTILHWALIIDIQLGLAGLGSTVEVYKVRRVIHEGRGG